MKHHHKNEEILLKYTAPTKACSLPYGQIWKHLTDDGYCLWIQAGKEEVHWMTMAAFLEKAFAHKVDTSKFISECLDMFEANQKSDSN